MDNFKIGKRENIKLNLDGIKTILEISKDSTYMKSISTRKRKPKKQPTLKELLHLDNISQVIHEDENSMKTDSSRENFFVNEEKN